MASSAAHPECTRTAALARFGPVLAEGGRARTWWRVRARTVTEELGHDGCTEHAERRARPNERNRRAQRRSGATVEAR